MNVTHETQRIKKDAMLKALESTLGVVSAAAKLVGMDRTVHYDWLKADEEYAKAVQSISEAAVDFAESALHKNIADGKETSTIFYLKTKGKHRGYIEKQEVESTNVNVDATDSLDEDQKRKIAKLYGS